MRTSNAARWLTPFAVAATAGLCASACAEDDVTITSTGTVEQKWTIDGSADPPQCDLYRADRMRLVLIDALGQVQATAFSQCRTLRQLVLVPAGDYVANATFVSGTGVPVSETLVVPRVVVLANATTALSSDFTAEQMLLPDNAGL